MSGTWAGGRSWRLLLGGLGLVALASAGYLLVKAAAPGPAEQVSVDAARARATPPAAASVVQRFVLVYVSGAVVKPGLYRLAADLRVFDAVAAAGGLLADADPARLPNLAARLSDGKEVKVPRRGSGAASKINVNTATAAELAGLPGIDAELAQAIVDFRDRYGPYLSLADFRTALDMDPAMLGLLRPYITVAP